MRSCFNLELETKVVVNLVLAIEGNLGVTIEGEVSINLVGSEHIGTLTSGESDLTREILVDLVLSNNPESRVTLDLLNLASDWEFSIDTELAILVGVLKGETEGLDVVSQEGH
jgi:hypothetical protein